MGSTVPREVLIERRKKAWALRQDGFTHSEIAAELGLDRSTITKMLALIYGGEAKALEKNVAPVRARLLEEAYFVLDEALTAWKASKGPQRTVTRVRKPFFPKRRGGEDDDSPSTAPIYVVEITRRTEYSSGNPAYLAAAMHAIAEIKRLTGAEPRGPSDAEIEAEIEAELARLAGDGEKAVPAQTEGAATRRR